ncbi:Hypothetical protein, putative [Bodo saltans]|uniref:Uncharacterized protein n=1 Tax=Bodo saltans TaxID=75058 RepID=A0A0S4JDH4_BODSA|nr:Hypothetical protein, putative [Bodo saltans]|eukprot:CUG88306.1 Hypothetical protein, putative [Bodo saltans]
MTQQENVALPDDSALHTATRDELLDHIHLQRKLIRRLYKRIIELEQQHGAGAELPQAHLAHPKEQLAGISRPQSAPPVRVSSPPLHNDAQRSPQKVTAYQFPQQQFVATPPPTASAMDAPFTPRPHLSSAPYIFPSSFQYHATPAASAHASPTHVSQRVVDEIARIDSILYAHEQASEGYGGHDDAILGEEAVLDLHRMRDKLAVVLRTPFPLAGQQHPLHARTMSFSPSNVAADNALEELHSRGALFRGMSAHTAPREKATAEDVLACAQWAVDTPLSSRTNTPFAFGGGALLSTSPQPPMELLERRGAFKDAPLVVEMLGTSHAGRSLETDSAAMVAQSTPSKVTSGRMTPPRLLVEKIQSQLRGHQGNAGWSSPTRASAQSPQRNAHQISSSSHRRQPFDGSSASSPWRRSSPQDCRRLLAYRQRQRVE